MTNYARGAARERQVQKEREQMGWVVTRCAGSKGEGAYDLHCSKAGHLCELVQVKTTRRSPFADFGPAERGELLEAASRAGARARLCWYPPDRKGARWLDGPDDWP